MCKWVCQTKIHVRLLGGNPLKCSMFEAFMDLFVSSQGKSVAISGNLLDF